MPNHPTPVDPKWFSRVYDEKLRWKEPCDVDSYTNEISKGKYARVLGSSQDVHSNWVEITNASEQNVDQVIDSQIEDFRQLKRNFCWHLFDYDQPKDLEDRLLGKGFKSEEPWETFLARSSEDFGPNAKSVKLLEGDLKRLRENDGITIEKITDPAQVDLMVPIQKKIWGKKYSWIASDLKRQIISKPDQISVYFAIDPDNVVRAYGWVRFLGESGFAMFSGGTTDPDWRGKGIYRSIVGMRLRDCFSKGKLVALVGALDTSRPILERLGFNQVARVKFLNFEFK